MLADYLKKNHISIKSISDHTGIAYSTVHYIANNRTPIERCSAETLYKIAHYLDLTMDQLYEISRSFTRQDFELFKSEIAHQIKDKSQVTFLIETIESNTIENYWKFEQRIQALYLLSMVDYLSRLNGVPQCSKYDEIRSARIEPMIYPLSVKMEDALAASEDRENAETSAQDQMKYIPEFLEHGIAEGGCLQCLLDSTKKKIAFFLH